MATKIIELPGVGPVTLVKRAQNRSLRLSVSSQGVRVSMPRWAAFQAGAAFAADHTPWIMQELAKLQSASIMPGQAIGKLHRIHFEHVTAGQSISSRVAATTITVKMQSGERYHDAAVQERAHKAINRALKREAAVLLPPRLQSLGEKHGLVYRSVTIKALKRRWGSCDSHQDITLNLYLMELPWDYIDYVLLHELAHTKHMNHGETFWKLLVSMQPRARDLSRRLRRHQPGIGPLNGV